MTGKKRFPSVLPMTRETLASDSLSQDQPVGRAALFTLLVALIPVMGPHVSHLPEWCSAFAGLMFAWRAWLTWRSGFAPVKLPSKWLLMFLLVLVRYGWWGQVGYK